MKSSLRMAVIIALAQSGVLTAGILAVAASNRMAREMGNPDLRDFLFSLNHGGLLLPLPLIWVVLAGSSLLKSRPTKRREPVLYLSGFLLLLLLVCTLATDAIKHWRQSPNERSRPTLQIL